MSVELGSRSRDPQRDSPVRTDLASSATAARDAVATNSPSSSPHPSPRPVSSSSLSSPAVCKSPLASKPADVSPASWCARQVHATIAPVSRVSCTSCSTLRPPFLARDHTLRWILGYFRSYSLLFRMLRFSFFILDSSLLPLAFLLVSFAIGLRPPSLLSTSRSLSRFDISYIRCLLFGHRSPLAYDAARSVAGGTLSLDFDLPFPFPLSLCVAYNVPLRSWTQ